MRGGWVRCSVRNAVMIAVVLASRARRWARVSAAAICARVSRAARLTRAQIAAALTRAHRRDREAKTTAIMTALRTEHLTQPPLIAAAYGVTVRALASLITTSNEQITALER